MLPTSGAGFSNPRSPVAGGFSMPPQSESFDVSLFGLGAVRSSLVWPFASGAWQSSVFGACCAKLSPGIAAISETATRRIAPRFGESRPYRRSSMMLSIVERAEAADRMDGKLACRFVGHEEKTEKSPCSSAPSCPFGTACSLMGPTRGYAHGSGRSDRVATASRL